VGLGYFDTAEEMTDAETANTIRAGLFQGKRNDFRQVYVDELLDFTKKQGVIYDDHSVFFVNEDPKTSDTGEAVVVTGFLDGMPSFIIKSAISDQGMIGNLTLYPGVLGNKRFPVNLTPAEALAVANSREKEDFPLSWDNVFVEFAYSDLQPGGQFRSAVSLPFRQWEAYPVCYVRPYKVVEQGFIWRETYVIDAVTKELLRIEPAILWFGYHDAKKPSFVNLHRDATAYQLFRATPPEGIEFNRPERLYMSLFGGVDGHISADGHYVRVPNGVYYSPKALATSPE